MHHHHQVRVDVEGSVDGGSWPARANNCLTIMFQSFDKKNFVGKTLDGISVGFIMRLEHEIELIHPSDFFDKLKTAVWEGFHAAHQLQLLPAEINHCIQTIENLEKELC